MSPRSRAGDASVARRKSLASQPLRKYARRVAESDGRGSSCPVNRGPRRRNDSHRAKELALNWHATTILSVRKGDRVAIGGDGQVTLGTQVMKSDAVKIRKLLDGQVLVGFAGSAADGFALLERFEGKLKDYPNNVPRAATELAKLWRTDRMLRRLEAVLVVVDARHSLLLTGSGDVIQPSDGILATGSGGGYALAAARALMGHSGLSAAEIVRESLAIAGGIDIYTNSTLTVEELPCQITSSNANVS